MTNQKRKQSKKKQREQRGKERVLARRAVHRAALKEERTAKKLERKFRERGVTIVNDPERQKLQEESKDKRILEQLQRNQQILEALEKQYEEDVAAKREVNLDLEEKGLDTLEKKMEYLNKNAEKQVQENALGIAKTAQDRAESLMLAEDKKSKKKKKKDGFKFGGKAETVFNSKEEKTENSDLDS